MMMTMTMTKDRQITDCILLYRDVCVLVTYFPPTPVLQRNQRLVCVETALYASTWSPIW